MLSHRPKKTTIDPDFLLLAYCSGYFPMADPETGEIGWYSPDPRAIIDLSEFKIPRSLRATVRKSLFEIRLNQRFQDVLRACADRKETWISKDVVDSYVKLHTLGYAHSVECWKDDRLVGGLYGVAIGGAFFGESMFSRVRDASKLALVHLVTRLRERGYELLDTQFLTPHLARFGAREIPRKEYLARLKTALRKKCQFTLS